jgi:hypothetical protein
VRTTSPQRPHTMTAPVRPKHHYAKWRAATLTFVYVLMAVHIIHWKLAGKTVAPFELNEVMYTLEYGIVTAGFVFMAVVTFGTTIFGRVFCSWGCHILALQDLSAWVLGKIGIRPKAIRSRVLIGVPIVAMLYMFAWPQALRLIRGNPFPQLHLRTDAEGWASLTTENFWRNLPGPITIALTFLVCGFAAVYILGTRGFCNYCCPYGAIFRVADRLAPGRNCGSCTAVCKSHVRVHEELNRYGMVVSPSCLRDLDCVAACPKNNVFYGFGVPSLLKSVHNDTPVKKTYDFTMREEALLVAVFLVVLFVYRGLYDQIPFLLSIALGCILAYLTVVLVRVGLRPAIQLNRWQLKIEGRLTGYGLVFVGSMAIFGLFTLHSAFVHYHAFQGHRLAGLALSTTELDENLAADAIDHLSVAQEWGWIPTARIPIALADLHYQIAGSCFRANRVQDAEKHLRATIQAGPQHFMAQYDLGALLLKNGQAKTGIEHLRRATQLKPDFADGHYNLGVALWMSGSYDDARREIDMALKLNPDDQQTQQIHGLMNQ